MRRILRSISFPLTVLGVAASLLTGIQRTLACACCTNDGQRNVSVAKFDAGKREEINQLRFGPVANLWLGEADVDSVTGIATPSASYNLNVKQTRDRLVFMFRDEAGHAGALSIVAPATISIFEVDTRDIPDSVRGPSLYKEWKLTTKVAATGIFLPSSGALQRVTLIVQGRGNSCTSSSDFTHWTLVVAGPMANFSFIGELMR
jgi:hypothetical protein